MKVRCFVCHLFIYWIDYHYLIDNNLSSSRIIDQYETLDSLLNIGSLYENNPQSSISDSNLTSNTSQTSLTPPFQKKLPILFVIILGFFEIVGGLLVLVLEILIFDIGIGLWCGIIYAFAGTAAIVFGLYFRQGK